MGKLERKMTVTTPQSILIEETALQLAAAYYEQGRSLGLASKFKTPQAYAKKYVTNYIPLAVSFLMDMLGKDSTPADQKEMIYQAFLERANDPDLSYENTGLKAFEVPVEYKSDKHTPDKPLEWNTKDKIEDLPMTLMLKPTRKLSLTEQIMGTAKKVILHG
jgi:hypothetical protein